MVAVATVAVALVGLSWAVAAAVSPDGDGTTTRATSRAAVTAPQQVVPSPSETSEASGQQAAPAPDPALPATAGTDVAAPDPATTDPLTSERLRPAEVPGPATPSTPVPVPPSGPVPCTNDMITVTAGIDAPAHRVGERPVLRLVVVNTTDQPCVRDLDAARQEIVVWSADLSVRHWSSNDCQDAQSIDLRTLLPNQPVAFDVRWAGRTTVPGCTEPRTVVPAGSYNVMTRVDDDISAPTPFERLP